MKREKCKSEVMFPYKVLQIFLLVGSHETLNTSIMNYLMKYEIQGLPDCELYTGSFSARDPERP